MNLYKKNREAELSVRLHNSLKQFNLSLDEALSLPELTLKTIGFSNYSIKELQSFKQETKDYLGRSTFDLLKQEAIEEEMEEFDKKEKLKCTCERPDDNTCDFCDAKESKIILEDAKLSGSKKETLEEVANKQWGNVHRTGVLGFIDGAKWQSEDEQFFNDERVKTLEECIKYLILRQQKSYSEEDMEDAFNQGMNPKIETFKKWLEKYKKK